MAGTGNIGTVNNSDGQKPKQITFLEAKGQNFKKGLYLVIEIRLGLKSI